MGSMTTKYEGTVSGAEMKLKSRSPEWVAASPA
jgi:hypothetical protein